MAPSVFNHFLVEYHMLFFHCETILDRFKLPYTIVRYVSRATSEIIGDRLDQYGNHYHEIKCFVTFLQNLPVIRYLIMINVRTKAMRRFRTQQEWSHTVNIHDSQIYNKIIREKRTVPVPQQIIWFHSTYPVSKKWLNRIIFSKCNFLKHFVGRKA
jgi:hypothetical protein